MTSRYAPCYHLLGSSPDNLILILTGSPEGGATRLRSSRVAGGNIGICMGSTSGDFGKSPNIAQCTAMSKRSRERCKGPAILGSVNQKCRMHGGKSSHAVGPRNASYKHGRYSKFLPEKMAELYEAALDNPDLINMSDHIAILEARAQFILEGLDDGEPFPRWGDIREIWDGLLTAVIGGDMNERDAAIDRMENLLNNGMKWDKTWVDTIATLEQLRKMTDTEVKVRKELSQMVPIERVTIMMGAVGEAVKRHVTDPDTIAAIHREIAALYGGQRKGLVSSDIIDIPNPDTEGPSGGKSEHALRRARRKKVAQVTEGVEV